MYLVLLHLHDGGNEGRTGQALRRLWGGLQRSLSRLCLRIVPAWMSALMFSTPRHQHQQLGIARGAATTQSSSVYIEQCITLNSQHVIRKPIPRVSFTQPRVCSADFLYHRR